MKEPEILHLIEAASTEIDAYRKRQLTAFREAIIVIALITWAVNTVDLSRSDWAGWVVRVIGGTTCILVGVFGTMIYLRFSAANAHLRIKRERLVSSLQPPCKSEGGLSKEVGDALFYPVTRPGTRWVSRISPAYVLALLTLAALGAVLNVLGGFTT